MSRVEAVQLIKDEEAEDDERRGVVPKPLPQESDYEPELHETMA